MKEKNLDFIIANKIKESMNLSKTKILLINKNGDIINFKKTKKETLAKKYIQLFRKKYLILYAKNLTNFPKILKDNNLFTNKFIFESFPIIFLNIFFSIINYIYIFCNIYWVSSY